MTQITTDREAKKAGLMYVGEFATTWAGDSRQHIFAATEDFAAVKVAYDAIDDGDLGPTVLDDVLAAGGCYVSEAE
jgi:hypothetical protein